MLNNYKCEFDSIDDLGVSKASLFNLTDYDDSIELRHLEYKSFQQEDLLKLLIESCYSEINEKQMSESIEYLYYYLTKKTPDQFPSLVTTTAIPILINAYENYNNIFAFFCLYNITSLFSDTTQVLLDNNIFDLLFPLACLYQTESFRNQISLSISAIINILIDSPEHTEDVAKQLTPDYMLGPYPYNQIPKQYINESSLIFGIVKLFKLFFQLPYLPDFFLTDILTFYVFLLNQENPACKHAGLTGIQSFLKAKSLTTELFQILKPIDFIDMADFFNDFYIEDHEKYSNCLDIIVQCFDIYSSLAKYSFRDLSYNCNQILKYCANLDSEESHFDDEVGYAALKMIESIFDNCEIDCYQSFIYHEDYNFLDILNEYMLNGSYKMMNSASKSLSTILRSIREVDIFLNEKMFETLMKAFLDDSSDFQSQILEIFYILFERAREEGEEEIAQCITLFDLNDGCEAFLNFHETTDNEILSKKCIAFLDRYFPLE